MKTPLKTLIFFILFKSSFVFAQDAEFIWAEDGINGSQIYMSQHKNGAWQPAEKIVDDNNLNILPAIGSDAKGQHIAVWSMVDGAKSILEYSIKRGNSWTKPAVLADQMTTNLAPIEVFDSNDVCWVFWSANDGGDDDIYVSKFIKGSWSAPERVNEDNDTPDILPEAGLDDNGNIWVSWQQLQEDGYVEVSSSFETNNRRKMASLRATKMQTIKQLKLRSEFENPIKPPSNFSSRSRATMYFPNDKKRPSKAVKGKF